LPSRRTISAERATEAMSRKVGRQTSTHRSAELTATATSASGAAGVSISITS
jgi:hypothetical protein